MRDHPTPPSGTQLQAPRASALDTGASNDGFVFIEAEQARSGSRALLRDLFSAQGRYARDRFWVVYLGAVALAAIAPAVLVSPLLMTAFLLALTWILFCCIIKRFHDRDKSGWWVLVGFVPFLGTLWILVECGLLEGRCGVNAFGNRAMTLRDIYERDEANA